MKRKCWKCRETYKRNELEEHHLLPKDLFDNETLADRFRIVLCEDCHKEATREFVDEDEVWIPGPNNLVVKDE